MSQVSKKLGARTALAVAIAALVVGCDSDNGSSGGGAGGKNNIISAFGGLGGANDGAQGGDGGYFYIEKYSGPGDIVVTNRGSANASFSKMKFEPSFGARPLVISDNTEAQLFANCDAFAPALAAGTVYQVVGQNSLFVSDGDTAACESGEVATGLDIERGATLTLAINAPGDEDARAHFDADVRNDGTLTVAVYSYDDVEELIPLQMGGLELRGDSYIGNGDIVLSAALLVEADVDEEMTFDGVDAGDLDAQFDYAFINNGAIDTAGYAGTDNNGGDAGNIYIEGDYYLQNTGDLLAAGAAAPTQSGGSGGSVELQASYGGVYNSGDISVIGGAGEAGGDAGYVEFYAEIGDAFNSGDVSAYGGAASDGDAGGGAGVQFYAYGGDVRNTGDILAYGAASAGNGTGGNGGYLYIYAYDLDDDFYNDSPVGDVAFSGEIQVQGGDAAADEGYNGGDAGDIYGYAGAQSSEQNAAGSTFGFYGYKAFAGQGGDGDHGGNADASYAYQLFNYDGYLEGSENVASPGGSIVSEIDVDVRGGDAVAGGETTNGNGGIGGYVYFDTDYYQTAVLDEKLAQVHITGDFNLSGGQNRNTNSTSNGRSGDHWVWGNNGVTVKGNWLVNGGDDIGNNGGTDGRGGYTQSVYFWAELGAVSFTGSIENNGGDGEYQGGNSGGVYIQGKTVAVKGDIAAVGGNADPDLAGSTGGTGGYVELKSIYPQDSSSVVDALFNGGTGDNEGSEGGFFELIACTGNGC